MGGSKESYSIYFTLLHSIIVVNGTPHPSSPCRCASSRPLIPKAEGRKKKKKKTKPPWDDDDVRHSPYFLGF